MRNAALPLPLASETINHQSSVQQKPWGEFGLLAEREQAALALRVMESFAVATMQDEIQS